MPGMDLSILHALIFLILSSAYETAVQSLSHVSLFVTPWTAACQVPLSTTISWGLLIFTSIESTMLSNHLILCCTLLLLTSIYPSIRVFTSELAVYIRWPKYWSFSFSLLYGLTLTSVHDYQFSSVTQSCPTLCDPKDCSTPCFPVHHQLLELIKTHVHWVGDAIQPSHPLSSPSPPAFNVSQHQGLFQWVSSSHQVVKVLEFQLQHQSFQWIFRTEFL